MRSMETETTCTVVTGAAGHKCGAPAVHTFKGAGGEVFAECAEHTTGGVAPVVEGFEVGETVTVHRYGKAYRATIVKVGARGAAYAEFTYGTGAKRTVRV